MVAPDTLSRRERVVYDALVRAADASAACPTNPQLCGVLGDNSTSSPVKVLERLVDRRLIEVRRFQNAREVTILASGKSTAPAANRSPHWRDRPGVDRPPTKRAGRVVEAPALTLIADDNLPAAVDRDPCPRCGTRRDIGCDHRTGRLAVELSL